MSYRTTCFRAYVRRVGLVMGGLLALVVGINGVVDPYDLYGWVDWSGEGRVKPVVARKTRQTKAEAVIALRPQAVILGSSRAAVGLNPRHPGFTTPPVYNLAMWAINSHELWRYFEHARAHGPVRQAVVALDFYMFNVHRSPVEDYDPDRLSEPGRLVGRYRPGDLASTLVSADALGDSLTTVAAQFGGSSDRQFLRNGQWWWQKPVGVAVQKGRLRGHRAHFLGVEGGYLAETWAPTGQLALADRGGSTLEAFRQMVRSAYQDQVAMTVLLSPCHARLWLALRAGGWWGIFEQWKRALVLINQEEGERANREPYPLWDFTAWSGAVAEAVPKLEDVETAMRWYWDSSHYKSELGDRVLDRVLLGRAPAEEPDFGVRITTGNIESHLAALRDRETLYRRDHPGEVAEIERLAANVRQMKNRGRADGL